MIRSIFVEKRAGFDGQGQQLLEAIKTQLHIEGLKRIRVIQRYDVEHLTQTTYEKALWTIFAEPQVDQIYESFLPLHDKEVVYGIEYLPGQYDQRADSCEQAISILNPGEHVIVKSARLIVLSGDLDATAIAAIKAYTINPVDSREAALDLPDTLETHFERPEPVPVIDGFIEAEATALEALFNTLGLAMTLEDFKHTQHYFKTEEKRNPTMTEMRVLDTYWSDHCRHTTFLTEVTQVTFDEGASMIPMKQTYEAYLEDRQVVLGDRILDKPICMMDLALMAMRKLRQNGQLEDLEVSEEINACSIIVDVDVDGKSEPWLVMFKNETHNHPTEIEPFGGAATCLGGAIRDPLSGRAYVYQAMRVTGAGDPRTPIEDTLPGKLPQRKIVTEAAHGYSAYGNQIGLATGLVDEIYHPGYVAKRMEIGAVIAATRQAHVRRESSDPGDIIVLLGGRTGRDGCGGATGSSKAHTTDSIEVCGAEVQKGNPPTERKLQRLFRDEKAASLIKKCNDFGAGGVSVAIGELADGLVIDLDQVPKKYMGLDGTELAISESQERMAVVLDPGDVTTFIALADAENLEAVVVAHVTEQKRLIMHWQGQTIVDVSRAFLDTNGAQSEQAVHITAPKAISWQDALTPEYLTEDVEANCHNTLADLNVCSKKGLVEMFDSTIGAGSVLLPFGGRYQKTPTFSMVSKIPMEMGETHTGTIMTYGFDPDLSSWSPFHGAVYSVVDSVAKVVATGGHHRRIRLTFQEYFKRLGMDAKRWGEPFSALLGAYQVQNALSLPSIGGKDSMSGTFHDLDVPPTLVSFAVNVVDVRQVITPELKGADHALIYLPIHQDAYGLPDYAYLHTLYDCVHEQIGEGHVYSAHPVGKGGLFAAISKMSFGNQIGADLSQCPKQLDLWLPAYGALVLEVDPADLEYFSSVTFVPLGHTIKAPEIRLETVTLSLEALMNSFEATLESVFKTSIEPETKTLFKDTYEAKTIYQNRFKVAKPEVFIPTFPGTNCEYDSARAFREAGAIPNVTIFRNLNSNHIKESIKGFVQAIDQAQMILFPGGFSAGDEPEGSGKFIATIFRNEAIQEAVNRLLYERDGLILGICNGFQALIKLGLVPYGQIQPGTKDAPTLTYNSIGRHISCVAHTKIMSNQSPWLQGVSVGDCHAIPVSHGEGRFVADEATAKALFAKGQVVTTYVDLAGNPTMAMPYNPNGSMYAIEGIMSPDGRVLGKMGHSERTGQHVAKNIHGNKDQGLFQSGVRYFG